MTTATSPFKSIIQNQKSPQQSTPKQAPQKKLEQKTTVATDAEQKRKWFGYVSRLGSIRVKTFVPDSRSGEGRRTTKEYIQWCEGYIFAHTAEFEAKNKADALIQTEKILASKIAELKKLRSEK